MRHHDLRLYARGVVHRWVSRFSKNETQRQEGELVCQSAAGGAAQAEGEWRGQAIYVRGQRLCTT